MLCLKVRSGWWMVLGALALPAWAADETLESAEKKLTAASEQVKAIAFKMTMNTEITFQDGFAKEESVANYEFQRVGEKTRFRSESKSRSVRKFGEQETKQEATILMVGDGEYTYRLDDLGGQKRRFDPSQNVIDFKAAYAQLTKDYDLKLLPDEKLDGKDVFVIEATPKVLGNSPVVRLVFYFAKDLALALKITGHNKEGAPVITSTITEVKLNPELAPDRFTFKAPEGVQVRDMTKPAESRGGDQPEKPEAGDKNEKPEKADKPDKPNKQ